MSTEPNYEAIRANPDVIIAMCDENKRLKKGLEMQHDVLNKVARVACGEDQIECDGDYNDSDGMHWIYAYITDQVDHFLPDIEALKGGK